MVNKCVAFECNSGYWSSSKTSFNFPLNKPELLQDWIRSVNKRIGSQQPTLFFVNFTLKFISRGKRCKRLLNLIN